MESVQGVVVGDSGVGKTSLLHCFFKNEFPRTSQPAEVHAGTRMVDGNLINLEISDTESHEHFKLAASGAYPMPNVVLICFSVVDRTTFKSVQEKWTTEARQCYPNVPLVIVGTKMDLRDENGALQEQSQTDCLIPVVSEQGDAMVRELKAAKYIECSSLTQKNVTLVFDEAVRAVLNLRLPLARGKRRNSKCKTQ